MNADDIRHRLNLIRDSLIGVSYHLPDPEVLLYPFLDNNLLLHQSPLLFAIWEGDRCIFSSLKDPDILSRHSFKWDSSLKSQIRIGKTPYSLSVHRFPVFASHNREEVVDIPIHEDATDLTRFLLQESESFHWPKEFFPALEFSITSHRTDQFPQNKISEREIHIEMDYAEVKAYLDPFRLALDKIFEDTFRSKHLAIKNKSLSYPNVFTVVRSCPTATRRYNGVFDYTAGLLLLSKMNSVLKEWYANTGFDELKDYRDLHPLEFSSAEECFNALENPLGENSRSVSDLVFSSGIVDFGRRARETQWDVSVAGDPFDEQRRTIERYVYRQGWRLFYIPVHVGGTPWLALFTFTPQNPASNHKAWHHNYSFYRDLVQKVAALIRQEAQDVYAVLLAKHFVKHMESWITPLNSILSGLNRDAQKLAQVYPFPIAKFTEDRQSSNSIFVPGRGVVSVSFKANPFFTRQVAWSLADEYAMVRLCREAIGDFTRIEQSIEINAVAQSSHLLKIPLRILGSIASSTSADKEKDLHRQIRKILELHDVASALMSEAKRDIFRKQYMKDGTLCDINMIFSDQCAASVKHLVEPAVSGNLAPRFSMLMNRGCVHFTADIVDGDEVHYAYFEPLIASLIEGLLTNAIDAVDSANPYVLLKLAKSENSREIFLSVENTTDIDPDRLALLVRNLNSPGPDMVGITELYWMSKACWPNMQSEQRLSWTLLTNPSRIVARAIIAREI